MSHHYCEGEDDCDLEELPLFQKSRLDHLKDVHKIQGMNGNWNFDSYMHGMYNGLELALSFSEDREPIYKEAPKEWLSDIVSNQVKS